MHADGDDDASGEPNCALLLLASCLPPHMHVAPCDRRGARTRGRAPQGSHTRVRDHRTKLTRMPLPPSVCTRAAWLLTLISTRLTRLMCVPLCVRATVPSLPDYGAGASHTSSCFDDALNKLRASIAEGMHQADSLLVAQQVRPACVHPCAHTPRGVSRGVHTRTRSRVVHARRVQRDRQCTRRMSTRR